MNHRALAPSLLIVAACSSASVSSPDASIEADAGTTHDASVSCPAPTGPGTDHPAGDIRDDQIWRAADAPHRTLGDITIRETGSVTIEPCAEVQLRTDAYLYVHGRLVARGEADRPIVFRPKVDGERFASVFIRTAAPAEFAYVTIEGGGGLPNSTGGSAVIVEGLAWPPAPGIHVEHVSIRNSAGNGITLRGWAQFTAASEDLTITGAGFDRPDHPFPLRVTTNAIAQIPSGDYTGNARDEIQVGGQDPHSGVELDDAFHDRGVPYYVGGNGAFGVITVRGDNGVVASLTIDPGVTIKFSSPRSGVGGLFIGGTIQDPLPRGRLLAVGTAAQPIVLTSTFSAKNPGDWEGVTFFGPNDPQNQLEHLRIEYAGAHGGDNSFGCPPIGMFDSDGALKIFNPPTASFLNHSTIAHSSSHGVYRAWQGDSISFIPTNTFEDIAGCLEVEPKLPQGGCPMNRSCPR